MIDERAIRIAVDNAVDNLSFTNLVDDHDARSKISRIIQDAIVAALKEYDKQK